MDKVDTEAAADQGLVVPTAFVVGYSNLRRKVVDAYYNNALIVAVLAGVCTIAAIAGDTHYWRNTLPLVVAGLGAFLFVRPRRKHYREICAALQNAHKNSRLNGGRLCIGDGSARVEFQLSSREIAAYESAALPSARVLGSK